MRSLRARLSLSAAFIVLATVVPISLLSNLLISRQFEAYVMEHQRERTEHIVYDLSLQYDDSSRVWNIGFVHAIGMYALQEGYIIKVYDENSKIIWDAENHDMEGCEHVMEEVARRMEKLGNRGEFMTAQRSLVQDGEEIGTASFKYFGPFFLSERDFSFLNSLNTILLAIGAFSLLFSFVIGWFLAARIASPITKAAEIAKRISVGNYDLRFEGETRTTELDNLSSAVNHLSEALEKQESLRKQLTADVAHELRTPLASLASHIETMMEGIWEPTAERLKSCYDEIMRLGKMTADLERLERVESENLKLDKSPVDLREIARAVCDNFAGEIANKDLTLTFEGETSRIIADKDRIGGAISNLMSNAVKYTPPGGHINVFVRDSERDGTLTVEDDGIGVSEEEQTLIFERFYRADKSRNRDTGGAGIGLAIVKSVVTAHGGTVTAQSRPEHGSRFIVSLPK
ncbi:MAG: HAMP domain-containing protein [Synergistaceae bacterium]|jgi:signal transduction histidine kinase|nr:HAMP domain-containing protein [Synergistaceae bacterium]